MKCLRKFVWVKIPRAEIPHNSKGMMLYFLRLASRAAFRKGKAKYCGHTNEVDAGCWVGGVVGLKSILEAKSRRAALEILDELQMMGYITYTLEPDNKRLTYRITDWVCACAGKEEPDGNIYATPDYGFVCMPRNITERLAEKGQVFAEADAWLDLWCHTVYRDYGNAFSFLAPAIQYGKYGSVLTLETLGQRWKWEKTKVWRFFQKFASCYSLHKLPGSFGCVIFNACYPTVDEFEAPGTEDVMRILELIRIQARNTHTAGTDNERLNRFVAWKSRRVLQAMEDTHNREAILEKTEESSDFRDRQNSRVAEIPPIIRAYFSHGRNCKNSRKCIYDCQGISLGEVKCYDIFTPGEVRPFWGNPFLDFNTS